MQRNRRLNFVCLGFVPFLFLLAETRVLASDVTEWFPIHSACVYKGGSPGRAEQCSKGFFTVDGVEGQCSDWARREYERFLIEDFSALHDLDHGEDSPIQSWRSLCSEIRVVADYQPIRNREILFQGHLTIECFPRKPESVAVQMKLRHCSTAAYFLDLAEDLKSVATGPRSDTSALTLGQAYELLAKFELLWNKIGCGEGLFSSPAGEEGEDLEVATRLVPSSEIECQAVKP